MDARQKAHTKMKCTQRILCQFQLLNKIKHYVVMSSGWLYRVLHDYRLFKIEYKRDYHNFMHFQREQKIASPPQHYWHEQPLVNLILLLTHFRAFIKFIMMEIMRHHDL